MRQRDGKFVFFLTLLLVVIILLQWGLLNKNRRFNQKLDEVITDLADQRQQRQTTLRPDQGTGDFYPGDIGGWRVWAFRVEPKTLNPISTETDIYARWMTVQYIFEPLLEYDHQTLEMVPKLADWWEVSDDGLEYIFHIDPRARFSDGAPVTADDVIFTYETIVNPLIDAANLSNLYIDVESAHKIDERTVKFRVKRPYFKFIEVLGFWDVGVLPEHIYRYDDPKQFNAKVSNPVGSGPYVFERWKTGTEVVLARNENYWDTKPPIDKIVYRFIPNAKAAVQALKSGDVDMIIPTPEQYAQLVEEPGFKDRFHCLEYWNPAVPFYYMGWNQDYPPFADRLVRLAMTHIVDREKIVKILLKDHAEIISGPFFIHSGLNDPDIEPYPWDIEKAKELLARSGWTDTDGDGYIDREGRKFTFKFAYAADSVLYQQVSKILTDNCRKVGIEVVADPYEWSVLITRITDRNFEAMIMGWGGDILEDFYQIFHSSQIGNRGSNYVGYASDKADALLEEFRQTLDEDKRRELARQFHRVLHHDQPYTFLFTRPTFRIVDKRFENVKIYPLGPNYFEWYVPERLQKYD